MSQDQTRNSLTEKAVSSLDLFVRNPKTHNTWDQGRFTSYEIVIQTTNQSFCLGCSYTRRRYSDFEWLKKKLKQHHPRIRLPKLPPKKYFGDRFDPGFIAYRMKGLEKFLNELVTEKMCMSDVLLHLFLQSNLENNEMNDVMEGRIPSDVIDRLWKNGGDKTKCREFQKEENPENPECKQVSERDISNETDSSEESSTDSGSIVTDEESSGGEVSFPPITMVIGAMDISKVFHGKDSGVSSCDETGCTDTVQSLAQCGGSHDDSDQSLTEESLVNDNRTSNECGIAEQKSTKDSSKLMVENGTGDSEEETFNELSEDQIAKTKHRNSQNVCSNDIISGLDNQTNCSQVSGGTAGVVAEVKFSINNDSDNTWTQ